VTRERFVGIEPKNPLGHLPSMASTTSLFPRGHEYPEAVAHCRMTRLGPPGERSMIERPSCGTQLLAFSAPFVHSLCMSRIAPATTPWTRSAYKRTSYTASLNTRTFAVIPPLSRPK
jgi:hypothetical protein